MSRQEAGKESGQSLHGRDGARPKEPTPESGARAEGQKVLGQQCRRQLSTLDTKELVISCPATL